MQNQSSPRIQPISQTRQDRLSHPIARQFSLAEAQRRHDQLKQDLQREADMVDQLEASQLDLERENRQQQRRAEIAEARIDALEKQVQSLERGLGLANDQTRGLKLMVSEQDQQIADQQAQINQQQAIDRQIDLSTSNEPIEIREMDRTHLKYEDSPVTDLDTAKDLINHLTKSVEEKERQVKAAVLVIDELTNSRDGFEFDNGVLQAKVRSTRQALEESHANFNQYHAECEHEFELAEEAKADQAEVIEMLADEKVLLQAQIQDTQQTLQEANDAFNDYYAHCENEFQRAEQEKIDRAEFIEILESERLVLQQELQDLQSEKNDLASTNERLNAEWREELELLKGQKEDQQNMIVDLTHDKYVLEVQVKEAQESERTAWELVHKKTALRRQENKDWLADAERADACSARLKEEIKKWQKEAAELKEKIDELRSQKLEVYDAWRQEVKYLDEKIKEGEDENIMLKDQITVLEEEVQEMIAHRTVSDIDAQDKNATEPRSTSTLRGSSPAFEAPGSPIYDLPGSTPLIDESENGQHQPEFSAFIHDDEPAAIEHLWEHKSDNNVPANSNDDDTDNIKEREPSWGGPWEQATGKRCRGEEDAEIETWAEKARRLSQPESKRRRLQH